MQVPTTITTDRLTLRKFRPSDAAAIFANYASNPEVTKFVSWPTHQNIEDTYSFLKYTAQSWDNQTEFSFGIIENETDRLVGGAGFQYDGGKVFIGYVLSADAWGNGYATEAAKAIVSWVKSGCNYFRIWTFCDAEHDDSANVLRKIGFKREALIHNWCIFPNQHNRPKDCLFFVLPND